MFLSVVLFSAFLLVNILNNKNSENFINLYENFQNSDKISKLRERCGMPQDYSETGHCFADGTHQTCCMLGPEARNYADNSGNPIGAASVRAFEAKNGRKPNKDELTPWCTCFGSKVCSTYAKMFPNDGTHIKFVNNPNSNTEIRENVSPDCEGYFRNKFSIKTHGTPGISSSNSHSNSSLGEICENESHSKLVNI